MKNGAWQIMEAWPSPCLLSYPSLLLGSPSPHMDTNGDLKASAVSWYLQCRTLAYPWNTKEH